MFENIAWKMAAILPRPQCANIPTRSGIRPTASLHCVGLRVLIRPPHWDRDTHICVSKRTIIGSDHGLPPYRRQAIIWTNARILLGTNFSEILGEIHSFSFKKMHFKMSSAKGRLFSLGLNELKETTYCAVITGHGDTYCARVLTRNASH